MISRAVESHAGEGDRHAHEDACLNCGVALTGAYCSACGQRWHVHRTIAAFFHDIAHGVFHFEGKIWHTLPLLAWRPGVLTRRYIDGQRARFVSPMALFLFSVFLMFAALHSIPNLDELGNAGDFKIETSMKEELPKARAELARHRAERGAAIAAHRPTDKIDAQIAEASENIRVITDMQTEGIGPAMAAAAARGKAEAAARGDPAAADDGFTTSLPFLKQAWNRARANPDLALLKVQGSAYKFSWLLIPLSVPFLWLLFPFSRRFALYDHAVFVTYSLAAMSLVVCLLTVGGAIGLPTVLIAFAVMLYPPFHMYRQLRGTYALSRVGAAWRTIALLAFAVISMALFAALMIMNGLGD